jgi:hypothetical protein
MIRLRDDTAMGRHGRDDVGARATIARKAWRLGAWSGITILCVAAAVVAAYTETGAHRLASGDSAMRASGALPPVSDSETRRLADAVRVLTADRDRLAARMSVLERNLDDVTGAIPQRPGSEPGDPPTSPLPPNRAPGPPAAAASPSIVAAPTTTMIRASQAPAVSRPPSLVTITADAAATGSTATRTEFGIDLGTAATVEGLRNLWSSIKGTQAPLVEGLRPVVAVRDGAKPGTLELRLVVGPLANAGVAAKLCAALAEAGLTCAPAVFDGQRLALN